MSRSENTIYQFLRAWAEETPQAIALAAPGRAAMTYEQLLHQIDSIAKSLRETGIDREDRIAMVLPNGLDLAVMFLGVSCSAVSVPLNPSCQENEAETYLSGLGARALLAQLRAHSPAITAARRLGIPIIEVVSRCSGGSSLLTLEASAAVSPARQRQLKSDHVALILHTSGTTSKPKRVPLTHGNLCSSAVAVRDSLALTSGDRCLGVMPLFHIHGLIGGLLSSLAAGASFVASSGLDPGLFFDSMEEFSPTWYTAVPAIHQAILRYSRDRSETIGQSRLRFIRSSSAPLPQKVMAELEELFKAPVIEAYGMTEAAHQITSNPLPPLERKAGSVGLARHTQVAVMDSTGDLLAPGGCGEVVLRGASVTTGYEDNGAAAESFTNGWFRTGDLGYFDEGGYLFLTGRRKEIINRGGEKISPREIDEALLDHPTVLQAAAFAVPHPSLGEDIAAAVVVRDPAQATEGKLREYLNGRLAPFKVPARLLIVEEIPKSSTGKIQRSTLAGAFAALLRSDFVAPRNQLEALVAEIYAEVLETQHVGAGDNFFALGGDSLRATQVISRLRSLFSVDLPIATLFSKATVAALAEEIAASMEALDQDAREVIWEGLRVVLNGASGASVSPKTHDENKKFNSSHETRLVERKQTTSPR